MWLILNNITQHASNSDFCVLKYEETKEILNGYKLGLDTMISIGFLRSKDGQRFIWKGKETEHEIIAHLHQYFQNTTFCDCELTDDIIHAIIKPQTQEEDKTDKRIPFLSLKRNKARFEKYKQDCPGQRVASELIARTWTD